MKKVMFGILTLILLAIPAHAAFVFERHVGQEVVAFSAHSLAMGSTGLATGYGPLASLKNPALLGNLPCKLMVQITPNVTKNDENRAFPIFDSFDSYIDDAVYASNAHFFNKFLLGLMYNVPIQQFKVSAAYSYTPLYDFNFKYIEEVRNNEGTDYGNEPHKIATNTYNGSGMIYAHTPAVAVTFENKNSFFKSLSLGASFSLMRGDNTTDSTIIFTPWAKDCMMNDTDSIPDVIFERKNDYSGYRFQTGMLLDLGERFKIGMNYTSRAEIDKSFRATADTAWTDTTVYYPSRIGFGFEYHPRNVWDTRFSFEISYVKWSDYNPLWYDVIEYYAGVEHQILKNQPFRLGFRYQPYGIDKEVIMTAFSAGTSIQLPYNMMLDLGAEIGKLNYNHADLFPDGYYANDNLWDTAHADLPVDRMNLDKIDDVMINFMATLTWRF